MSSVPGGAPAATQPYQSSGRRKFPLTTLIWFGISCSCLGLIGFAGWSTWKAYQFANDSAVAATQNLVRVLKQHTERTIDSVDMLIKMVARELGPDSANALKRSLATESLAYLTQDMPHVLSVRLFDSQIAEPLFEFSRSHAVGLEADHDARQAHASSRYLGLHVGLPFRDPVSGNRLVGISRRITGREGIPGQVVIAHVSLDYLQEFYDSLAVGRLGSITLIRSDGTVLARRPDDAVNAGLNLSESKLFRHELPRANVGSFETVAVSDGITRVFSYHRLEELPLILSVGLAKSEILETWVQDIRRDGFLALAAMVLLVVIGAILSRQIKRRDSVELALTSSEERLRLALNAGRMIAWELNPNTGFVTRSENSQSLIGLGSGYMQDFLSNVHPDDRPKVMAADQSATGQMTAVEVRYFPPQGEMLWLELRAVDLPRGAGDRRILGTAFDITHRKSIEEQVWHTASHDGLTGLANRSLFQVRLEEVLQKTNVQTGECISLILIDFDNLKEVNDTLGHDAGDALLQEAARRLRSFVRDRDTVARLGGDEFALVMVNMPLRDGLTFAEQVLTQLERPFMFKGRLLSIRASTGIATCPDHHGTPAELMKDADIALYAAKAQGRRRVAVYSPRMRAEMEQRVHVLADVKDALEKGHIVPFYQPKICLSTGEVVGFEALARWQHPTRGILAPDAFAAVFGDYDLAAKLGMSMVQQIASDIRTWTLAGLPYGRIAINISAAEFNDPLLAERLLQEMSAAGVSSDQLEIEVTESVLLGRTVEQVGAVLQTFHQHGVTIALDDFGTGYASLSHLKQFPVDVIKIDRSFVGDLENDPEDAAIVSAVIGLGKSLDIQVVAEGVESVEQVRFLRERGCDQAQGYLFSKPLVASRVPWFIREGSASAPTIIESVRVQKRYGLSAPGLVG